MNYYVYRLDDPITNQFYFGSRSSKLLPENDIDYMGSMKTWKPEDKSRLIKTIFKSGYKSMSDAIEDESRLISKEIDNPLNENYYIPNKGFHTSGIPHTEEWKIKMSNRTSGKNNLFYGKFGEEHPRFGHRHTKEWIESMKGENNPFYNKTHSEETRSNWSKLRKGQIRGKYKMVECPHCNKKGSGGAMKQWHFDNCKYKK